MKQQQMKNTLRSELSSKKIDLNFSFKQSDFSSSNGFKSIKKESSNEVHKMDHIMTGVEVLSKLDHTPHLHKNTKLQGSSMSNKEGPPSVHNIKQKKANDLRFINEPISLISDNKETPSLTEVKASDLIPFTNRENARKQKGKNSKKLTKFANFGIEISTHKGSDKILRSPGKRESHTNSKVKIKPNEVKRKGNKSKEKVQSDCNKIVRSPPISDSNGICNLNFANMNLNSLKSTSEFIKKQEKDSSAAARNHLYKLNSRMMNQNEADKIKPAQINQLAENMQDIYIEGKNSRQKEPVNKNLLRYINGFRFETPSSNTAESTTAATSMRKISNRFSPSMADGASIPDPILTESSDRRKPIFTPKLGSKNLMKQSLERINKAIKRYDKNIGPDNVPGLYQQYRNPSSPSQARENLESEGSSLFGSVIMLDDPKVMLSSNKELSENIANSIVCDSETNIENFTLGPAQFKQITENASNRNYDTDHKEDEDINLGRNKKDMQKFSSADRLHSKKRKYFVKPEPSGTNMLRYKSQISSPLVLVDGNSTFKRDRGSAPSVEPEIVQKLDFQKGVIIDKNYKTRSSLHRSDPIHIKFRESKSKIPITNQDFNPLGCQKYMGKFRMRDSRQSRACHSMKRTIKIGKNKKIPKDFFS
ncbi:unnamed protein product [Moneuplotes crassus]|uniref:Uncharacterized protein n=1 Tax=Euplotes crassus TaxID=5936 RepID=A0AAD2D672_EUPCR|nr:unnamed protein product [Moneuplotes crassus]